MFTFDINQKLNPTKDYLAGGAGGNPPTFNLITSRSFVSCDIDIITDGQVPPLGCKSPQFTQRKIQG